MIVGANGDGGAAVDMLAIEIVEEGMREVGTEAVLGRLVVVLEVAVGPRVRVNCVAGTGVVGVSSVKFNKSKRSWLVQ